MEKSIAAQLREIVRRKMSDATTVIDDAIDEEIGMEVANIFRGVLEFATSTYDFVQELVSTVVTCQPHALVFSHFMM